MRSLLRGRAYLWLIVLTGNLLALMEGITLTWTSPVLPKLEQYSDENPFHEPATEDEITWIGSLLSLGAIFGPFIAAIASSTIGRKTTLLILGVPYVVSFTILAFATDPSWYYFSRTIQGMSGGSVFTILPTYLTEISEASIRGAVGTSINIYETTGMLFSYAVGPYTSVKLFNLLCLMFPCVFLVLFAWMPETPQYLLSKKRDADALTNFNKLRGGNGDPKEFEEMRELETGREDGGFRDLYTDRASAKALGISVMMLVFQQLSGINVVLLYAQSIFEEAGGAIPSEQSPIIFGAVQVIAGFVTPVIVDRYGRKILLLVSAVGMMISEGVLGLYFFLDDTTSISWLPVVCLVLYITCYGVGFGPLPWIIMAELLPPKVKSIGAAITAAFCWTLSFVLTKYFDSLSDEIGTSGSFWLFTVCNAIAIVFTVLFVPETKEKSPTEIQEMLKK